MKERSAIILLLLASLFWGFTFVFQSEAADLIGAGIFNASRMIIGFIVLSPLVIKILKKHKGDKSYVKKLMFGGFVLGLVIAFASYLQQLGIGMTTTGKAGFITSLYSLFVPILAIFIGRKTSTKTWVCVVIGLCGAFLLSINGDHGISKGDALLFFCALLFAIQIIVIDVCGKDLDGVDLSAFQFLFGGLFSFIIALFSEEEISFTVLKVAIVPILYAGIFSCGVAYTLQIIGQKYIHPAKATLVLSLESVWAALGGALILHESMSIKEIIGCVLLFAAVVISQISFNFKFKQKKE